MTLRTASRVTLAALACAAAFTPARAQEEPVDARLERVAHIKASAAERFLDTLRRTVGRDERAATCALLAYPLPHATGVVKDASDCESRYDRIFTIPVRKAIGMQRFEDLFAGEPGVMIGMGEVWFSGACPAQPCAEPTDLRIRSITSDAAGLRPPKDKVLLACFVSGQRIRVVADGQGGASLLVWRDARQRNVSPPDLDFPRAQMPPTPSSCGSRTWTFDDGQRTYVVSDLPCDAYLSPPPMGSVGRVTLSTPASPGVPLWCIE